MNTTGQLKSSKPKRLRKKEFVEIYVYNSIIFDGETPTKADINSTYNLVKNFGKRKRVKRNSEPEMSKEEFVERHLRNSRLFGETPNEEEANRWYDLYKLEPQYNAIRGKTKKEKREKKEAFFECMEQEIMSRYSPAKIEGTKGDCDSH